MTKTNKKYQKPELTRYGDINQKTAAKESAGGDGASQKGSGIG